MRFWKVPAVGGLAVTLAAGAVGAGVAAELDEAALAAVRPEAVRAHTRFLADDLLEGRGTGARGYDLAALYVATQLEALGLEPGGADGSYFQTVPLRRTELVEERTGLVVLRDGAETPLTLYEDFVTGGDPRRTESDFEAEVVFVGYGVSAPELGYDDYAGVDVRGKIVAYLFGGPSGLPSAERAHLSSSTVKAVVAEQRGAVGILALATPELEALFPWTAAVRISRTPGHRWLDAQGEPNDAPPGLLGGALLSRAAAQALFARAPKGWTRVLEDAAASRPQAFGLPLRAHLWRATRHEALATRNVAAILRGSDPALRDEYVVYTAHLDHEGIGEPVDGDAIYNGAVDNAVGVAQVLEVARGFARLPERPRRSILFLAVAAEESGLLGSDYFANFPTVPIEDVVAELNIDGGLILYPPADVVYHGAEHSTLGAVAERAASRLGLRLTPDPMPEQSFFVRSDQYSFVKQGVPALSVFPGLASSDPAIDGPAAFQDYLENRYHKPADEMDQPMSFEAAAIDVRLHLLIGWDVAQADTRPAWLPDDFFGRTFGREGR